MKVGFLDMGSDIFVLFREIKKTSLFKIVKEMKGVTLILGDKSFSVSLSDRSRPFLVLNYKNSLKDGSRFIKRLRCSACEQSEAGDDEA